MLDDGQRINDYYKIRIDTLNKDGWIYRKLVRRFDGVWPPGKTIYGTSLSFELAPNDYYSTALGLTGDELKNVLHEIIKDHKEFSYGEVWDILKVTDIDPND